MTVPTKYKGFCARLRPRRKSRSLQDLLNPDISIFLKKEGKGISSQISLEFAFTDRKANRYIKILKVFGNW